MIRKSTEFIAIHCSATGEDQDIGAAEIREWHLARGWVDIGYHYVIRRNGRVENGRPPEAVGAHVEGFNSRAIGVCMVGGVDADDHSKAEDNYTPAQWQALERVIRVLRETYPKAKIQGHRDFPNVHKACPCFDVAAWLTRVGILNPAT